MATTNRAKRRTIRGMLADWWRSWRREQAALAEMEGCSSDLERIAHDVGLTAGELRVVAAKRPDAADLLFHRLAALHLDARKLALSHGAVLHDLQRLCTACESKRRCARDLAENAVSDDWHSYCPNAETLNSLVSHEDDRKALARIERRQPRFRNC